MKSITFLLLLGVAHAHEFRPAQVAIDAPTVTWVAEADRLAGRRPGLVLEGCTLQDQHIETGEQQIIRATFRCPQPPTALTLTGLPADLKVIATAGRRTAVLDAQHATWAFSTSQLPPWLTFIPIGIEHILLGLDHLLFVLGFILLVPVRRRLALALTGFTLGHSLTLAAATLGWIHIPSQPIEAIIALSVVFLAAETLRDRSSLTRRRPAVVAVTFGLLHGLGFAGALAEILPQTDGVLGPLLGFNLGVELGQILFVIAVLATASLAFRLRFRLPHARLLAGWTIGGLAGFWVWDRTAAFFGM